jgi:type IV secretory pathway TrbD component
MTQLSTGNESVTLIAQATFGRDSAMFEGLLGFVAQLSVVLWGLVLLTVVVRYVGVGMYRRGARRRAALAAVAEPAALAEAVVPSPAVPAAAVPTITAVLDLVQPAAAQLTDAVASTFGEVLQPAEAPVAVAGSANAQGHAHRNWRSESHNTAHLPALASNSTEA